MASTLEDLANPRVQTMIRVSPEDRARLDKIGDLKDWSNVTIVKRALDALIKSDAELRRKVPLSASPSAA